MDKRRFVVCFDGTWNTPDQGDKSTNVVKMVRAIRSRDDDGVSQVTFYDKGVGTAGGTDKYFGGLFGRGLNTNVVDGYRFLANNYELGDEIYIFGFSRGAYTARSLAGLIGLAGLLSPAHLGSGLHDTVMIYRNKQLDGAEKRRRIAALGLEREAVVPIRSVGVWDTVGSLGVPGDLGRLLYDDRLDFNDVELGRGVDVALHAVAIDEKRGAFPPTLWTSADGGPTRPDQVVEQVWFPGVHSNIGGSYSDTGLSDTAFCWMARRLEALTGLALDPAVLAAADTRRADARGVDSRTGLYVDAKIYPYQRIISAELPQSDGFGGWFRDRFTNLDRRNVPEDGAQPVHERLHVSALERWQRPAVEHDCAETGDCRKVPYRPANLAAVIAAHRAGRSIPVVGWEGEPMDAADVPWPAPPA